MFSCLIVMIVFISSLVSQEFMMRILLLIIVSPFGLSFVIPNLILWTNLACKNFKKFTTTRISSYLIQKVSFYKIWAEILALLTDPLIHHPSTPPAKQTVSGIEISLQAWLCVWLPFFGCLVFVTFRYM